MYMYHLAYNETPEEDRLKPDAEFKPNLVNSVTYMVEALVQVGLTSFKLSLTSGFSAIELNSGPNLLCTSCSCRHSP